MAPSDKIIVCARTDGLGARLITMSFAKALADRVGCRFGFTWNARSINDKGTHRVDIVSDIFDRAFVEKYWLGETIDLRPLRLLEDTPFSLDDLKTAARSDDLGGWNCGISAYQQIAPGDVSWCAERREAFRQIGFSPRLRDVMARATAAPLPEGAVALHLRAGDIVYGYFRSRPHFTSKVVPAALAPAIIDRLKRRHSEIILFGEDQGRLEKLRQRTGCRLAEDFGAPQREAFTDRAFFELTLMSRCRKIYGRDSGFIILASIPNLTPILDPGTLFTPDEMKAEIRDELQRNEADYEPREAAYGYLMAADAAKAEAPKEQTPLIESAFRLDPDNHFYPLKLAALAFAEGRLRDGEAILASTLDGRGRQRRRRRSATLYLLGARRSTREWKADIQHFAAAAEEGCANAAAFYAVYLSRSDPRAATRWAGAAVRAEPWNLAFIRIAGVVGLRAIRGRNYGRRTIE